MDDFVRIRRTTRELCAPLQRDDYGLQSMPDASPPKWHLAHTTWFFEAFVLCAGGRRPPLDPRYEYLFNSYYDAVGARHPRPERGLLSRPTLEEVEAYRRHVDEAIVREGATLDGEAIALGLHHEQQHQELLLTDVKHAFAKNPLRPAYAAARPAPGEAPPLGWVDVPGGVVELGHDGAGFAFDNEGPRHPVALRDFRLASRLVTAGEYAAFVDDGGYARSELWLADGWAAAAAAGWRAPLYWEREGPGWRLFTLAGTRPLHPAEPVCHVSFYEADAYARWAGARLPTEAEWEHAAAGAAAEDGGFLEGGALHPRPAAPGPGLAQLAGECWQWTASAYLPYPGFRPAAGALGEYNGKFMCNQMVLRGASCVTPRSHARLTYRNFFPPAARWQFSGIRLARDAG